MKKIHLTILGVALLGPTTGHGVEQEGFSHLVNNMLPQGRVGVRVEYRYGVVDSKFDARGGEVALADKADGIDIGPGVLPALALLGPAATLGTTDIRSEISGERRRLTIGYGLTDHLTVGVVLPWEDVRNKVHLGLQPGNLALNPAFDPNLPVAPGNLPFVPVGTPGTQGPAGIDEVSAILSDPGYGYAYKPLGSATSKGMLDPSVGLRWCFHCDAVSSWILTPGFRIGLTEKDDPDDLFDVHLEKGTDAVFLSIEYFRRLSRRLDVRFGLKHTRQLPDERMARALASGEYIVPISRKERLEFDLGDKNELDTEAGYRQGNWRYRIRLSTVHKGRDAWHSPSGQDVAGLQEATKRSADYAWIGFSWSGVESWQRGSLPMPLLLSFDYRAAYRGHNSVKSRDLFVTATAVF